MSSGKLPRTRISNSPAPLQTSLTKRCSLYSLLVPRSSSPWLQIHNGNAVLYFREYHLATSAPWCRAFPHHVQRQFGDRFSGCRKDTKGLFQGRPSQKDLTESSPRRTLSGDCGKEPSGSFAG